jgi:hypothetical protein
MRVAAVQLASRLTFPLNKGAKTARSIIKILKDEKPAVRIAGLAFLSLHGVARDEAAIRELLADQDKEVRIAAERSLRLLHLRISPEAELQRSIRDRDNFDDDLLEALKAGVKQIGNDCLIEATSDASGALRTFAARELFLRGALTDELARRFVHDDSRGVRESGYRFLAAKGEALDFAEVKNALKGSYLSNEPSWNKGDPVIVIQAALERLPANELAKKLIAFNDESVIAIRVIGSRLQRENLDVIRELLGGKLDELFKQAKSLQPPEKPPHLLPPLLSLWGPLEAAKGEIETAALEILADKPTAESRSVFLRHVSTDSSKSGQLIASLRGLAKVGLADDRAKLLPFLSSKSEAIEWEASIAYLGLSPTIVAAANDLLASPTKTKVWCIVSQALKTSDTAIWKVLEKLLFNEDEDIRRMACYFAVKTQTKKQLTALLNKYLTQGWYYYNVVVIIDRALYAPKDLAALFLSDEEKWTAHWE